MGSDKNICPACGYPDLNEPPYDDDEEESYEICPSCFIQFGNDDQNGISFEEWRNKWISEGMKWCSPRAKPLGWNPVEQLENLKKL